MGLADKLNELSKVKTRKTDYCPYQAMYNSLTPENQKALDEAWAKGFSANLVLSALRSEGIKSSNEAIRLHFKGLCKCPKK
jgi:hypothetical protein